MSDIESVVAVLRRLLQRRYCIEAGADPRLEDIGIDSLHIVDLLLDFETELDCHLAGIALPSHVTLLQLAGAIAACLNPRP
jgi:acyl carrier protein